MALRPLLLTAALTLGFAAPAGAAELRAGAAVERSCAARLLAAGAPGSDQLRHRPASDGLLTAVLDGRRGDWDLAAFDASTGRRLGAAASASERERVTVAVRGGESVVLQACRRTAGSPAAALTVEHLTLPRGAAERVRMVEVALDGPGDRARLEASGLDVTHAHGPDHADVVIYSAAEAGRLRDLGLEFETKVDDLLAETKRTLARPASASRAAAALPSGRTTYRTLADYQQELKTLAAGNPGLVRHFEVGRSVEDRPIEAVEIATNVERHDDGRPVFLVVGLHHAREWPSGEMPMEFALDLVAGYGSDPRITDLLDRARVIAIPVVNPDGFEVSRSAPDAGDGLVEVGAYKRKNCRPTVPGDARPCAARLQEGVDLNRNYGAYWGGTGSGTNPAMQNYRGPGPFSEPESEAIHQLSSTRAITGVISHHTYWETGIWLRQPGFCATAPAGCGPEDVVPDEPALKTLGDAMGAATGWESELAWEIGQITGATEDWNYFATGAYGYTPEQRGENFHPPYGGAVVAEYDGSAPGAQGGVREALLLAAETAADPAHHSLLRGTAGPGRILRLRKAFETPTSQPVTVSEQLDLETTVPADGSFTWAVNPSTRPLAAEPEAYTLTCETPEGTVLATREVVVARAETLELGELCPADQPEPEPTPTATPTPTPTPTPTATPTPGPPTAVRTVAVISRQPFSARRFNRTRRVGIALRVDGGPLRDVVVRLQNRRGKRRTFAGRAVAEVASDTRMQLRRTRRLKPGRYVVRLRARGPEGEAVTARRKVRARR